ncbi:Fe-S protein assembly co-chaperone HscB [Endozoicomonas sp. (ex Bugula neritina AB1)]|nr:Fe-S protein assembly co-chaperone HscB [Endozoicomonas sp. (ex Bugula neritina AB1)]
MACEVDLKQLACSYRELQKTVHPDRFAGEGERQQRLSVQYATHVNEAYDTLRSPLPRMAYLLKLAGRELDMENNTIMDPAFLMEQMEVREALSDLRNSSNPEPELEKMIDKAGDDMDRYQAQFTSFWTAGGEKELEKAEAVVRKMQFMVKLTVELEQLESELLDD